MAGKLNGVMLATTPSGSYASGGGSDVAFTNPGNAWDGTPGTYAVGTAAYTGGTADNIASIKVTFAAATYTGRGRITGKQSVGGGVGTVTLRYSLDGGSTWTVFATATSASDTVYYTPRLVNVVMANFVLEAKCEARQSLPTNSVVFNFREGAFDAETSGTVSAHLVNAGSSGYLELKGDGTNYAEARRRFPDKQPPASGTYITAHSPTTWQLKAQRLDPASGPTNPLEMRIEDELTGRVWAVATVAGGDIAAAWTAFTELFVPSPSVAGTLDIVIRTKDANGIRVTHAGIDRGRIVHGFQVTANEQTQGLFPDRSIGEATNWPKGKLSGAGPTIYRKVLLT